MTGFASVIVFGEGANTTGVVLGTLTGAETGGAVAGCFEFTVGHGWGCFVFFIFWIECVVFCNL